MMLTMWGPTIRMGKHDMNTMIETPVCVNCAGAPTTAIALDLPIDSLVCHQNLQRL